MTYNCRVSITPTDAWTDPNLSHLQCRLLGLIGSYMGKDQTAWPSQKRLAEDLGCSRKAINEGIKALKERGYIDVKKQTRDDGGQTSNLIHVRLDPLSREDHPPVTPELHPLSPPEVTPPVTPEGYTHKKDKRERHKKNVSDLSGRLWVMSPSTARQRSSKAKVKSAVKAALNRGVNPDDLMTAYQNYLNAPDTKKQGYQFAKGIHSWISEDRFEAWLSSSPQNQTGALPQVSSIIPMGPTESIDELLAKRDAECARSAAVGSNAEAGDASADLPGMQPHPQEETLEMFERDPRGDEDARILPSL